MPEIIESVEVASPVEEVYAAFAVLTRWPEILPDTVGVEILYTDGYNEEFTMTVSRPGGLETVRGVRYQRPSAELELVQTTPPPGFSQMNGNWSFIATATGTEVIASRRFKLAADDERDPSVVAHGLSRILQQNLGLFREAVERNGRP
jgi:hypothetical protein